MSQTLEIPDQVYAALVEAAKANGITPADWIATHLPATARKNRPLPSALFPNTEKAGAPNDADSTTQAQLAAGDQGNAEMDRPWRGVFAPEYEREVLFTQEMEIRTAELPRWEPQVTIDPRWIPEDER